MQNTPAYHTHFVVLPIFFLFAGAFVIAVLRRTLSFYLWERLA